MAEQIALDVTGLVLEGNPVHHLLLAHGEHIKSTGVVPTVLVCTLMQYRAIMKEGVPRHYLHRDEDEKGEYSDYIMGMRIEVKP